VQHLPEPVGGDQRLLEERTGAGGAHQALSQQRPADHQAPEAGAVVAHVAGEERGQPRGRSWLALRVHPAERAGEALVLLGQPGEQQDVQLDR
jgi:hypothetical protein